MGEALLFRTYKRPLIIAKITNAILMQKAASVTKKPKDEPIANGSPIVLKAGSKGDIQAVVFKSKVWTNDFTGIFIDISLHGTTANRVLIGQYGVYAFMRMRDTLFDHPSYGKYNYKMLKDGIDDLTVYSSLGPDKAPISIRVTLTAKAHRVGPVLAMVIGKLFFTPPVGDLRTPPLYGFPRDRGVLMWAAKEFYSSCISNMRIAIIGGKAKSAKKSLVTRFNAQFPKKYREPKLTGITTPKSSEIKPLEEAYSLCYDVSKLSSLASLVLLAQSASSQGDIALQGSKLVITDDNDTQLVAYKKRMIKKSLLSTSKTTRSLKMYHRLSLTDKMGGKSISTILAIAGICSGLNIATGVKIFKQVKADNIDALSNKVSKELANLVSS